MRRTTRLTLYLSFLLFLSTTVLYNNRCFSESTHDDLTTVNKRFLPAPDVLQQWSALKDEGGPAFAGSPSWKSYVAFLEKGFRERGLIDIQKESITYTRWFTSDEEKRGDWSLAVDGKPVRVASYWAYSGSTQPSGIKAPLIYYDAKHPPASIEGKIAVFDIPPLSFPPSVTNPGYEYASDPGTHRTDTLTPSEFGVPGLYLDRVAGKSVRQAAMEGRTATLKLLAKREEVQSYLFSGFLPGRNYGREDDEMILLIYPAEGKMIFKENLIRWKYIFRSLDYRI